MEWSTDMGSQQVGEFMRARVETLDVWDMADSSEHRRLDWTLPEDEPSDLMEPYPSVLLVHPLSRRRCCCCC